MADIALIGGTVFLECEVFSGAAPEEIDNENGHVTLFEHDELIFIPRHGIKRDIPPHRINHQANIRALKDRGVKWIVGVNSVGSLNVAFSPGSLIVPDDYINLWNSSTFFNNSLVHITPRLDDELRLHIIHSARNLGITLLERGIYIQTTGPRLETRAEIQYMKNFADVIGMTMGSEATAAQEMNIKYACIASIDNYAHGLTDIILQEKDIQEQAARSAEKMKSLFFELVDILRKSNR